MKKMRFLRAVAAVLTLLALTCGALADPLTEPFEKGPYAVGLTSFTVTDPGGRLDSSGQPYRLYVETVYPVDREYADSSGLVFPVDIAGTTLTITPYHIRKAGFIAPLDAPPVSSNGPFPVVIMNGGGGGSNSTDHFFTNIDIASHGFVVIAASRSAGSSFKMILLDRPKDVSLLIDTIQARNAAPDDLFSHKIDLNHIGVGGWSLGGFAALAVAGGYTDKYDASGAYDPNNTAGEKREVIKPDKRIKAIIMLDGTHTVYPQPPQVLLTDDELAAIEIPTLIMGQHRVQLLNYAASPPVDDPFPYGEGYETLITRAHELISSKKKFMVEIKGSRHSTFGTIYCDIITLFQVNALDFPGVGDYLLSELPACNPDLPDPYHPGVNYIGAQEGHRLFNLYTISFLKQYIQGDSRYNRNLNRGYAVSNQLAVDFTK